jgi:4-hydroxy 2-oxovalerate aldolase
MCIPPMETLLRKAVAMSTKRKKKIIDSWVTFRPELKILDATIRDGGLINNHKFTDEFVRAVYQACADAGVDYMEIGYKGSAKIYPPSEFGPWKRCAEEDVRRIVGDNKTGLKISVMADVDRTEYRTEILPKKDSIIDMIRVACYINQIPAAMDMIADAHEKGYETTLNIMAASTVQEKELAEALAVAAQSPVDVLYIVDSFGSMYSENVQEQSEIFWDAVKGTGKQVGMHAHNNQQLAYANTIEAVLQGVNYLDATINGMGRGAGNCALELLIGFLKNPKFKLRPVLQCVRDHFLPLAKDMEWGYQIPYMITGMLNRHPREAIKMRSGDAPDDYVKFYDQVIDGA